jgi:hypothetical protein
MMPTLKIDADTLKTVAQEVYEPQAYADAPAEIYLDHAWGEHTYLRCSFPGKITNRSFDQLEVLKATLAALVSGAEITIVVYFRAIDREAMVSHCVRLEDR